MRKRRIISALLIPPILLLFTGCTKTVWVGPDEVQPEQKLKGVVTANGQQVILDPSTARLEGDTIYAYAYEDGLRFALEDLQRVGVQQPKTAASVAIFVAVALVVVVAVGGTIVATNWSDN